MNQNNPLIYYFLELITLRKLMNNQEDIMQEYPVMPNSELAMIQSPVAK